MQVQPRAGFVAAALAMCAAASVAAIDAGGSIGNTTELSQRLDADPSLGQSNRLSLFVSHAFSDELEVVARGRYEYRLDTSFADDAESDLDWWRGDLDALYARGRFPSQSQPRYLADVQLGRLRLREFTGVLLNERVDGVRLSFETARGGVTMAGGYTGLLMKESSNLVLTGADVAEDADDDHLLAPPRLLALYGVTLSELFARQTVHVSLVGQGDLRETDELEDEQGVMHTLYAGGGIQGPIFPQLFYDAYGYFNVGTTRTETNGGSENRLIQAYMAGASLQYFLPQAAQSVFSLGYLYTSGDRDHAAFYEGNTDDNSHMFVGLSAPSFGTVFSPRLGNLTVVEASYSVKPFSGTGRRSLEQFQTVLTGFGFFRPTTGVISEPGINRASDDLYLGSEVDLSLNFRPFSDLGLSLASGVFFPNTDGTEAAFLEDAVDIEYTAEFNLTFSF